jgi:hypothetical protein
LHDIQGKKRIHLSFPGGGLLKLSKFGMGTVRMGTEGGWLGTDPAFTLSVI